MGLLCFRCHESVHGGSTELVCHYRVFHTLVKGGLFNCGVVPCFQRGCLRTFQYTWSLKRHLNSAHSDLFDRDHVHQVPFYVNGAAANAILDSDSEDSDDGTIGERHEEELDVISLRDIKDKCLQHICNLRSSSSITTTAANLVTDLTKDILADVVNFFRSKAKDTFINLGFDPQNEVEIQSLFQDLHELENPFREVDSDHKFKKFLKESEKFVVPVAVRLGVEYKQRTNPVTGAVEQTPIQKTFQYIPLRSVLKLILETPGCLEQIFYHHEQQRNDGLLIDFQDGQYYKAHEFFTRYVVRILLYIDDVEVTNPLSGKAGTHKLGCMYMTIKSLPLKYLSTLDQCYLVALYNTADAKHYGLESIVRFIVDDLKDLEVNGIDVVTPIYNGNLPVGLAQVVGDNLGVHSLLGFSESFSANYACRLCKADKPLRKIQSVANADLQRNKQNYEEDLQLNNLAATGIKRACSLNELQAFHVTNNFSPDVMHDLFEGVCAWEIKLVIRELIASSELTLQQVNDRITSYDYGFVDAPNKPSCITENDLRNPFGASGQNASQMWCLARHFCLIFGDLVEEDNPFWEVYILLLECMDFIFSQGITNEDTYFLKRLIEDHHELYRNVFDEHLRPKHHHMIHYPEACRKLGPLRQYWTIRFEAKHNFFKRISHVICNFKNIQKSLAFKHQIQLCHRFLTTASLCNDRCEVGPGTSVLLSSLEDSEDIAQSLGGYPVYDDVFIAKWAKKYGTIYRPGMMVTIGKTEELESTFGKIIYVLLIDNDPSNVQLVVHQWCTEYFSRHLHAYAVTPSDPKELKAYGIDDLLDFVPLHATKAYLNDQMWYISPRSKVA